MSKSTPMSGSDARRIMSAEYGNNGSVAAGSFAARAHVCAILCG